MKNKNGLNIVVGFLLCLSAFVLMASFQGDLNHAGMDSDGTNVTMMNGYLGGKVHVIEVATTTTAYTITAQQARVDITFVLAELTNGTYGNDPITFNLPACVPGARVSFIDANATAAADLKINPDDADKINGGTAGVTLEATGDAFGEGITLVGTSLGWASVSKTGTWTTGS